LFPVEGAAEIAEKASSISEALGQKRDRNEAVDIEAKLVYSAFEVVTKAELIEWSPCIGQGLLADKQR
jgi:hypothetical protein